MLYYVNCQENKVYFSYLVSKTADAPSNVDKENKVDKSYEEDEKVEEMDDLTLEEMEMVRY